MDDNRIIIDSANFNRNMPKWATEDTLNRLERMIGNSNKESQKSLKEVIKALKTISDKDTDLFKETQRSNKETRKELEKITKVLASSGSSNASSNESKTIKESSKTTDDTLKKGFGKLSSSNEKLIQSILNGNSELNSRLEAANKTHESVSSQLVKIHNEIKNISSNTSTNNTGGAKSGGTATVDNTETNNILGDIKTLLGRQNATQNRLLERSVSSKDFNSMLNRNAQKISDEYRDAAEDSRGTLQEMFKRANEASGQGGGSMATNALNGAISSLGGVVGTLKNVLKSTALGKLATIAGGVYAAATKTFEYAYDAQDQFRDMIDRGFNFGELTEQRGSDRLDGISLRATITENDIALETATEILAKNTRLINEVGISSMFTELGNIVGDINDPDSITNRLGMTRDQVALIVTDFYSMHRRINTITRDMSQLERESMASKFTENVRRMSQQLGTGLPQVREAIEQFTQSGTFTRTSTFMDSGQSENIAMLAGALGSADIPQRIQEALLTSATSPAGVNDPTVIQDIGSSPQLMELFTSFSGEISTLRDSNVEQQMDFMGRFATTAEDILNRGGGSMTEGMSIDPSQRQNLDMMSQLISSSQQLNQDNFVMGGEEEVSPQAQLRRELENMGMLISARTEDIFAQAADTDAGREAIMNILSTDEIMKRTQLKILEYADDMTQALFTGPIPTVLRQIKSVIENIGKALDFFTGKDHDSEVKGTDADVILDRLENNILGTEGFNTMFEATQNEEGKTVYNVKEGIGSEDLNTYFSGLFNEAESREEREAIAGSVKSLSRGLQGRKSGLSGEATDLFARMEESFLGSATNKVSGEERDKLLSTFEGFDSSVKLLGNMIPSNLSGDRPSATGMGITTKQIQELGQGRLDFTGRESSERLTEELSTRASRNVSMEVMDNERQNAQRAREIMDNINETLRWGEIEPRERFNMDDAMPRTSASMDRLGGFDGANISGRVERSQSRMLSLDTRPERREDDTAWMKQLIDDQDRREQERQYSESVRSNESSLLADTNNTTFEDNSNTINNDQQTNDLASMMAELKQTNQSIADNMQSNTHALKQYLNRQV